MKKLTKKKKIRSHRSVNEMIDEAAKESFPTSDPPAWTLGLPAHHEKLSKKERINDISYILFREHEVIRAVLKVVHQLILQLEEKQEIDVSRLRAINSFFFEFINQYHDIKEGKMLSSFEGKNDHQSNYLMKDLEHERQMGKKLQVELEAILKEKDLNKNQVRLKIIKILKELYHLYINHFSKEEEHVFPFIKDHLTQDNRENLYLEFKKVEEPTKKLYSQLKKLGITLEEFEK